MRKTQAFFCPETRPDRYHPWSLTRLECACSVADHESRCLMIRGLDRSLPSRPVVHPVIAGLNCKGHVSLAAQVLFRRDQATPAPNQTTNSDVQSIRCPMQKTPPIRSYQNSASDRSQPMPGPALQGSSDQTDAPSARLLSRTTGSPVRHIQRAIALAAAVCVQSNRFSQGRFPRWLFVPMLL